MSSYSIAFTRSARKQIERLDEPLVSRIFQHIEGLAENPRPADCRKLVGREDLWRLRVGDYRVVYTIDDSAKSIDIIAVRHRREVYR
ncbi:MAG TPA: type II toxin-antitoxin system RelE/ParE family toxin [Thermoanaerobaculia bacterium]